MLLPCFLAENKVCLRVYGYVRKGEVCTTLSSLQKSRPQKFFLLLIQKHRFKDTLLPCIVNVFMLLTVLRKSLNFGLVSEEVRKDKQAAGNRNSNCTPQFPSFISKQQQSCPPNSRPRALPPAAPTGSCFRKAIRRTSPTSLCNGRCNVTQRFHSSSTATGESLH